MLIGPLGTKPQWNFNQNTESFIHESASENIDCEMTAAGGHFGQGDMSLLIVPSYGTSYVCPPVAPFPNMV